MYDHQSAPPAFAALRRAFENHITSDGPNGLVKCSAPVKRTKMIFQLGKILRAGLKRENPPERPSTDARSISR